MLMLDVDVLALIAQIVLQARKLLLANCATTLLAIGTLAPCAAIAAFKEPHGVFWADMMRRPRRDFHAAFFADCVGFDVFFERIAG